MIDPGNGKKDALRSAGKRALDLSLAIPTLVLLFPLLLVIALLVRVAIGSPVLFRQERPGLHGRSFGILKFRTMVDARDSDGVPLPDSQRLTRLGRLLRRTSLDELPELFNVLRGDMSLVGPRPLLTRYLPHYRERECLRHTVKPGITGWAQIHGRNEASWDDRLEKDVWYVENWSLLLDVKIIGSTILSVLGRKGIVVDPRSTMLNLDEERLAAMESDRKKREGGE